MQKIIRVLKALIPRRLSNLYHLANAILAVIYYRYPARDLTVIGITGTDGKTTTSFVTYQLLKAAGLKVSVITSLGAIIDSSDVQPIGLHVTTPGPFLLQKLLSAARRSGSKFVVLETTSHGLDQHRVLGCNFAIGVVTNVTSEHLDYHGTFDNYLHAKAKLVRRTRYSLLNRDHEATYQRLAALASGKVIGYGTHPESEIRASNIQMDVAGMRFDVNVLPDTVATSFIGEFNIQNLLAAMGVAVVLGIRPEVILEALSQVNPPPGRLERIELGQPFSVFVDFAHTPNSLENLLKLLRSVAKQKLIVVFGCAGERDPNKRKPMGRIAAQYCDYTVITAEDPRTESLEEISQEIASGCQEVGGIANQSYFCIGDRQEAINFAIRELAQPGDIVVTTGKAHEQSMCFGTTEYPWDEFQAVRNALSAFKQPSEPGSNE